MSAVPSSSSASPAEVLLTTDDSGQMWNACVWDAHSGAALRSFKGGVTAPNTLVFLGDSYLVSAPPKKPLLNVWQLNRHEQQPQKYTTPPSGGPVQALAATPDGSYLVGACQDKLYVWQTCNGQLHRVLDNHFQTVTHVAFADDGAHFVSAAVNGGVFVWHLLEVLSRRRRLPGQSRDRLDNPQPRFAWSRHQKAVTGVHITPGGARALVLTVSADKSLHVHSLATGQLLLDLSLAVELSSVAADHAQTAAYLGDARGQIHLHDLLQPPRQSVQVARDADASLAFVGHRGPVTALSLSMDGQVLASGSDDKDVRLWDVANRRCLRILSHKGRVTSVRLMMPPSGMLRQQEHFKPGLNFSPLQKTTGDAAQEGLKVQVFVRERDSQSTDEETREEGSVMTYPVTNSSSAVSSKNGQNGGHHEPSAEVQKLKEINAELYRAALKKIMEQK